MVEFINVVELVSGGTGAATGAFCGFPLDTVKVNHYFPVKAHYFRFDFNVKVRVTKRERFACSRISSQKKAHKDFEKTIALKRNWPKTGDFQPLKSPSGPSFAMIFLNTRNAPVLSLEL